MHKQCLRKDGSRHNSDSRANDGEAVFSTGVAVLGSVGGGMVAVHERRALPCSDKISCGANLDDTSALEIRHMTH